MYQVFTLFVEFLLLLPCKISGPWLEFLWMGQHHLLTIQVAGLISILPGIAFELAFGGQLMLLNAKIQRERI